MYERQHGGDLEVGSYAHRPILMDADDIPSHRRLGALADRAALHPGRLRSLQMEQALELVPGHPRRRAGRHPPRHQRPPVADAGRRADPGRDARGPRPVVGGRDLDQGGAGHRPDGRRVDDDGRAGDRPPRLGHGPLLRPPAAPITTSGARSAEGFNKTYGIVHPMEQWATNRDLRLSPMNGRERDLGAVFFETAGWERPYWYESNAPLLAEFGDRVMPRAAEWEARWWSPIINAEHLAMRERVGHRGPVRLRHLRRHRPGRGGRARARCAWPARRARRPRRLHAAAQRGGRHLRRPDDHAAGRAPLPGRHRRRHGHARQAVVPRPPAGRRLGPAVRRDGRLDDDRRLGAAGARPRAWRPRPPIWATPPSRSPTCRPVDIGGVRTLASRISYVGELGWEIYVPMEQGRARLGHAVGRRPAARPRAGGHRHVRRHGAPGEGLSRPRQRSWSWNSTWSRRAWPGRRSRTPTSSAARRTSSSEPRRRRPSCAR